MKLKLKTYSQEQCNVNLLKKFYPAIKHLLTPHNYFRKLCSKYQQKKKFPTFLCAYAKPLYNTKRVQHQNAEHWKKEYFFDPISSLLNLI